MSTRDIINDTKEAFKNNKEFQEDIEKSMPTLVFSRKICDEIATYFQNYFNEICDEVEKSGNNTEIREEEGRRYVSNVHAFLTSIIVPTLWSLDLVIENNDSAIDVFFEGVKRHLKILRDVRNNPELLDELKNMRH